MLRGDRVGLRARRPEDVAVLHAGIYDDVPIRIRTDVAPWRPISVEFSNYAPKEHQETTAQFSVVELIDGEPLAGAAVLWGIDTHNQFAHLGLALLPAFRGRGLSSDLVRVLCHYGFVILNLRRLQMETLADNAAMIGAATSARFVHEGTMRRTAWIAGQFVDEVVYGLLRDEWQARVDSH